MESAREQAALEERLLDGRIRVRHFRLVVAIADSGSVVGAARALHVTQPVVSRGLHEVESVLGVPLFERLPRGSVPTVFGASFVQHARAILTQIRQAGREINELARADSGRVTVGTHLAGSNVLLPGAIARVKADHPGLTVVVREATPDQLYTALLSGEIDIVVGRLASSPPAGIVQERLLSEPIRLVGRVGHPATRGGQPRLEDLTDYPWILPVEATALRSELERVFLAADAPLPANRVECTSILTLRQLLVTGNAIAALPRFIADRDAELQVIDVDLPEVSRAVGVAVPESRPVLAGPAALLKELRLTARTLAQGDESVGGGVPTLRPPAGDRGRDWQI